MQSTIRFDASEHPDFDATCDRVEAYLAQFPAVEEQGGKAWRIQRALYREVNDVPSKVASDPGATLVEPPKNYYAVGGSELGVLLGIDKKFTNETGLLSKKAHFLTTCSDPESFDAPTMTEWGHIVEPCLASYVAAVFGTRHFALEASVVHRSVKNFRYSPDGFVVLRRTAGDGTEEGRDELIIAVLELKNPFGRVVKGDKVPDHYLPQVMSGMDTFSDLVTHGLFVEANFYVQSLDDYGRPRYNPTISGMYNSVNGKKGAERFDGIECKDACLVGFWLRDQGSADVIDALKKILVRNAYVPKHGVFDLGRTNKEVFEMIMLLSAGKTFVTRESRFLRSHGVSASESIEAFKAIETGLLFIMPIGIVPNGVLT